MPVYESWGRYPRVAQRTIPLRWRDEALPTVDGAMLPYGNGRSYGDLCLNAEGTLLDCRGLDRFIAFDPETGILRAEGGVLLSAILERVTNQGWFLPVTPGTRYVTLGGAIANDVHGKNHHRNGTFGGHLTAFELLRSDGARMLCTPDQNSDWFRATIGGLGLTGVITWAEVRLKKVFGPMIDQQVIRYRNLEEFFAISKESDRDFDYTVAWVDCAASGKGLGRGLFMRGNHAVAEPVRPMPLHDPRIKVPFVPPLPLVNSLTLRIFNALYYNKQLRKRSSGRTHFAPFFYPLDGVGEWNRIYGPDGMLQFQCAIPHANGEEAIREILDRIALSGNGSFLAVLKMFGEVKSPGLLSFPRPGITLALDFPNRGKSTFALFDQLERVTLQAGGALYPAKDARMSADAFQRSYPQWRELLPFIDPNFSSSFWRRVTE